MAGLRPLVLLWVLPTLWVSAGSPEVWVQVQVEAAELLSFTVRCQFLGSGSISLLTVSQGAPTDAGGTLLAVLHPQLGTQHWAPGCHARWETKSSISLTVEGSEANSTFCCKVVSFPSGSQEACGDLLHSTGQGLPTPTPAPILRAHLAGILGALGVLLGFILVVYLLHRQRHWSVIKLWPLISIRAQPRTPVRLLGRAELGGERVRVPPGRLSPSLPSPSSQAALHHPYAVIAIHPDQRLAGWAPHPTCLAPRSLAPAPGASPAASARSSFIWVENGLYAPAAGRPPHPGPHLIPSPGPLGPRALEGCRGVR